MKTKDLRKKLFDSIEKIEKGDMAPSDGRNIVGMANQINLSMQTELKSQQMAINAGKKAEEIGELKIA